MKEQELKKYHRMPGHMVSADNYILRALVRLYHTKGKSDPSAMFSGECFFIDHASGHVRIMNQVAINATETIKAKLTFEREAQSQVVSIKGYYTNNWILNPLKFTEELLKNQQKIIFSGAGASHQNGSSDQAINIVVTM